MEEIRGTDCNELIKKVLEVEELRSVEPWQENRGEQTVCEPDYFQKQMRYSL